MTLEEAHRWQRAVRDIYGIATRVVPAGKHTWVAEHDPGACCGHLGGHDSGHDPWTRAGACRIHYLFGASQFCSNCRPQVRCSEATREMAKAARLAAHRAQSA